MRSDGGSAFPSHGSMGEVNHEGMTLRDYFATAALMALIDRDKGGAWIETICIDAYQFADAMLKHREA